MQPTSDQQNKRKKPFIQPSKNIPTKFGSSWSSDFRENAYKDNPM